MPARERFELIALGGAALLVLALVGSAALGLLRPATSAGTLRGTEPSRLPDVEVPPLPRGRLEVLNGAGRAGLARQATDLLRASGFDVVYFGNASTRPDSSEVIDRVGRLEIARAIAERLGITRVRSALDSTLLLDATVILGRDWPRPAR